MQQQQQQQQQRRRRQKAEGAGLMHKPPHTGGNLIAQAQRTGQKGDGGSNWEASVLGPSLPKVPCAETTGVNLYRPIVPIILHVHCLVGALIKLLR
jgi:hypothetical protein